MHNIYLATILSVFIFANPSLGQDSSLLTMLEDSLINNAAPDVITGTFKATQIINTPTIETPAKKPYNF